MTEHEWLTATEPDPMVEFLRKTTCDRKLRLFAVACLRRIWHLLREQQDRKTVELAERIADGTITEPEAEAARSIRGGYAVHHVVFSRAWASARFSAANASAAVSDSDQTVRAERYQQAAILRHIIGSPFRPITLSPTWRSSTVTSLAQTVYDDRHMPSGLFDNQRMDILADALEDAGCDIPEILDHCRSGGEHVRGCWVVDLVLGKE
jgi:hypothetical protein